MSIIVDGDHAYKVFSPERGAVNVALRWFSDDPRQDEKPAMFIYPKPHVKRDGAAAFVIPLANAFQYQSLDLNHRADLMQVIEAAQNAAIGMKLAADKFTVTNICDAIYNYLPDLLAMPPKRMVISKQDEIVGDPVGEMLIKVDGKVIHQEEFTAP